jgi:hypothetical protein
MSGTNTTVDDRLQALESRILPAPPKPWYLMGVTRLADFIPPEGWELRPCASCECPVETNVHVLSTARCSGVMCRGCWSLNARGFRPAAETERPAEKLPPLERFSKLAHGKTSVPEPAPRTQRAARPDGRSS